MNKFKKILYLFVVIFLLITIPVFSESIPGLDDLQKSVGSFTDSLANSLPFNSMIGLNWSDAHIGKFPHLGIGITTGFTTMDFGSMNGLLNMFQTPLPDIVNVGGLSLPSYSVDARLGGFFLPFDIGVKFGFLNFDPDLINNLLKTDIPGLSMDYLLIGGDIRFALINGKAIPFKLSIGGGFNYLKGGMSMPVPGTTDISFNIPDGTDKLTLKVPKPELGLNWETKALDFKAQASFKLLVITPYIGIGASHAWSSAGYGITSKIKVTDKNGDEVDLDKDIIKQIEAFGISGISKDGFSHVTELTGWSFRTFGGFSINIPFVKFDFTGMYDLISECYGFTFGVRLQF